MIADDADSFMYILQYRFVLTVITTTPRFVVIESDLMSLILVSP